MPCAPCHADNRVEIDTEMIIHVSGLGNARDRSVLVF